MAAIMKISVTPAKVVPKPGSSSEQRPLARAFYDTLPGLVAKCAMALTMEQYARVRGTNDTDYFGGDPKRAQTSEMYILAYPTVAPWFWDAYEAAVCPGVTLDKVERKKRFLNRMYQMWNSPDQRKQSRLKGQRAMEASTEHPRLECPVLWARFCNTFSAGEVITKAKLTAFLRGQ